MSDLRVLTRFLFEAEHSGGHIRVTVRAGTGRFDAMPDGTETGDVLGGTRALAGHLTFRPEEWAELARIIRAGVDALLDRDPDGLEGAIDVETIDGFQP